MTMNELCEAFDLDGLQPSPGVFDMDKLRWMNGHYIRQSKPANLVDFLKMYTSSEETYRYWSNHEEGREAVVGLQNLSNAINQTPAFAEKAIVLEQERVQTLADFGEATGFFFEEIPQMDQQAFAKWLTLPYVPALLESLTNYFSDNEEPTIEDCEACLRNYVANNELAKLGAVVHPVRVALTGKTVGPGLFELMAALGSKRMVMRFRHVLKDVLNLTS
jgi:glutamyl/glutaminyl-tRNA synthetase